MLGKVFVLPSSAQAKYSLPEERRKNLPNLKYLKFLKARPVVLKAVSAAQQDGRG